MTAVLDVAAGWFMLPAVVVVVAACRNHKWWTRR